MGIGVTVIGPAGATRFSPPIGSAYVTIATGGAEAVVTTAIIATGGAEAVVTTAVTINQAVDGA